MSNILTDEFYGARVALVIRAAELLTAAINARPALDGTTVEHERRELMHGNAPFDYLDDLEARVGIDVEAPRALLLLAMDEREYFPDYWQVFAARYPAAMDGLV